MLSNLSILERVYCSCITAICAVCCTPSPPLAQEMKRESVGAAWSLESGHCLDIAVSWDSTTLDTRPAVCSHYLYTIHWRCLCIAWVMW